MDAGFDEAFREVRYLLSKLNEAPETAVKRWSAEECSDYQLPLIWLISFLTLAGRLQLKKCIDLSKGPLSASHVLVDIVTRSPLHNILEYDNSLRQIRYLPSVSEDQRNAIAEYLCTHGDGFAD